MTDIGTLIHGVIDRCPATTWLFIPILKLKDRLDGSPMHTELRKQMDIFCKPEQLSDPRFCRKSRRDAWYCQLRYHCGFDEYYMYRFSRMSHEARQEYVTEFIKNRLSDRINDQSKAILLADKWRAYEHFGAFYKRDMLPLDDNTSLSAFTEFTEKHPRFMIKPVDDSCGRGIAVHDLTGTDPEVLFRQLCDGKSYVAEELIEQAPELARFHAASVNTVRCVTMTKDGQPHVLFTMLRMGRGSSIIDNAESGGVFAGVDVDTGIIYTKAMSKGNLSSYLCHPDSGCPVLGQQLPQWEELKQTVIELARLLPELPYACWDMALSVRGWCMVEGNSRGQLGMAQLTVGHGIRSTFEQFFDLR